MTNFDFPHDFLRFISSFSFDRPLAPQHQHRTTSTTTHNSVSTIVIRATSSRMIVVCVANCRSFEMGKNNKTFRFLDLPAELRCTIYQYLLQGNCKIKIRVGYPEKRSRSRACAYIDANCKPDISAAIVFVNRQIYNEGEWSTFRHISLIHADVSKQSRYCTMPIPSPRRRRQSPS